MKDKIIQIQGVGNDLYCLTESGKVYIRVTRFLETTKVTHWKEVLNEVSVPLQANK